MACFGSSLDGTKGLGRFDCKARTKSELPVRKMALCDIGSHFLAFTVQIIRVFVFFYFILRNLALGSFLVLPPDGSRALQLWDHLVRRPLRFK